MPPWVFSPLPAAVGSHFPFGSISPFCLPRSILPGTQTMRYHPHGVFMLAILMQMAASASRHFSVRFIIMCTEQSPGLQGQLSIAVCKSLRGDAAQINRFTFSADPIINYNATQFYKQIANFLRAPAPSPISFSNPRHAFPPNPPCQAADQ